MKTPLNLVFILVSVGCAGAPAVRQPAGSSAVAAAASLATPAAAPASSDGCARYYAVAFHDVTNATRALLDVAKYKNSLVTTQLKPIQDTITAHLDPAKIDSLATCKAFAGELRLNVLDLRQALIELANVPRRDGRGPLVQNATITAIMYSRVSDRLRRIIY